MRENAYLEHWERPKWYTYKKIYLMVIYFDGAYLHDLMNEHNMNLHAT